MRSARYKHRTNTRANKPMRLLVLLLSNLARLSLIRDPVLFEIGFYKILAGIPGCILQRKPPPDTS